MRVNFGALRTRIAFDDLLLSAEQIEAKQKPLAPMERINNGIALLARTDEPSRTLRLAMGRKGSEGELFSAAIATIQEQVFIGRVPIWFDFSLIGAVSLLSLRVPRWKKSTVAAGCTSRTGHVYPWRPGLFRVATNLGAGEFCPWVSRFSSCFIGLSHQRPPRPEAGPVTEPIPAKGNPPDPVSKARSEQTGGDRGSRPTGGAGAPRAK